MGRLPRTSTRIATLNREKVRMLIFNDLQVRFMERRLEHDARLRWSVCF